MHDHTRWWSKYSVRNPTRNGCIIIAKVFLTPSQAERGVVFARPKF
jgi:hypothetical protein